MNCDDSEILINALIDGELDASHAHDVEITKEAPNYHR